MKYACGHQTPPWPEHLVSMLNPARNTAIGGQNPAWRRVLDVVVSPPGRGPQLEPRSWPSMVERRDQAVIGQPPRNVLGGRLAVV